MTDGKCIIKTRNCNRIHPKVHIVVARVTPSKLWHKGMGIYLGLAPTSNQGMSMCYMVTSFFGLYKCTNLLISPLVNPTPGDLKCAEPGPEPEF